MKKIPAIIHLIFLNKTEKYPEIFSRCIERIKMAHPAWSVKIYNEDDAVAIINEYVPWLLPLYNSYEHTVQKADLFRIILVYLFGGFYMDMDMFSLKPLNGLRKFEVVLAIEKVLSEEALQRLHLKEKVRIANYMFGSIPHHPVWLYLLRELVDVSSEQIASENDILETTGPGVFSNFWGQHKAKFPYVHLLANTRDCAVEKEWHKQSCFFGDYAAHLHQGTWRWQSQPNSIVKVVVNRDIERIKKIVSVINAMIDSSTTLNK